MSIPLARSRLAAATTLLDQSPMPTPALRQRRVNLRQRMEQLAKELTTLLNDASHESRRAALREWERKHTAACRKHQEDPGATCICRDWSDKTQGTR